MTELIPWVIAALGVAVALGLYVRVRAAGVAAAAARNETDKLRGELSATREQLTKSAARQRRVSDEMQQLRRKHDKAKKRAGRPEAGPGAGAARVIELEAELEEARQARDAARSEVSAIGAELSRLRTAARREEPKAVASLAPVAPLAPAAEPKPERTVPLLDAAAVEALQTEARDAASGLVAARKELAEQGRQLERLRAKLRTQELLYVSIRSELAAKKDRLRTQQEEVERLLALKVALVDAPIVAAGAAEPPVVEPDAAALPGVAPDVSSEPGESPSAPDVSVAAPAAPALPTPSGPDLAVESVADTTKPGETPPA